MNPIMASNEVIVSPVITDDVGSNGIVRGRDPASVNTADDANKKDQLTRHLSRNNENEIDTNHFNLCNNDIVMEKNVIVSEESNNNNLNINNNNCKLEVIKSPTSTTKPDMQFDEVQTHHRSSISCSSVSPSRSCDSNSCTQEDLDEISKFFENKQNAIERWLKEKAPTDVITRIHEITSDTSQNSLNANNRSSYRSPHRASVTSDLFQQWLTSASPVKVRSNLIKFYSFPSVSSINSASRLILALQSQLQHNRRLVKLHSHLSFMWQKTKFSSTLTLILGEQD